MSQSCGSHTSGRIRISWKTCYNTNRCLLAPARLRFGQSSIGANSCVSLTISQVMLRLLVWRPPFENWVLNIHFMWKSCAFSILCGTTENSINGKARALIFTEPLWHLLYARHLTGPFMHIILFNPHNCPAYQFIIIYWDPVMYHAVCCARLRGSGVNTQT